jgi:hypothetical protein
MSSQKDHEFKENLERCYKIVQQSSAKGGINAVEVAEKLGKHRTTVHGYLNTLEYMGKIESQHGTWHAKTGEQTTKPLLEKEIVIELPMPRDKWADAARLKVHADYAEEQGLSGVAKMERTILEQFDETRTIRIRGKNVDDIDLEKIGNLIQQANKRSSIFNLSGLFKGLRKSVPVDTTISAKNAKKDTAKKSSET